MHRDAVQPSPLCCPVPAVSHPHRCACDCGIGARRFQDAATSNAIIAMLRGDAAFGSLADAEAAAILQRDKEDGEKLEAGIALAVEKGVIDASFEPERYIAVDVLGKSADQVADEIIAQCGELAHGLVVVLCGLSGTGKGTTVAKLSEKLPNVTCWSNGNVFRRVCARACVRARAINVFRCVCVLARACACLCVRACANVLRCAAPSRCLRGCALACMRACVTCRAARLVQPQRAQSGDAACGDVVRAERMRRV